MKPLGEVIADEAASVAKEADHFYAFSSAQRDRGWLSRRVAGPLRAAAAHRALGLRAEALESCGHLVLVQGASLAALPVADHELAGRLSDERSALAADSADACRDGA